MRRNEPTWNNLCKTLPVSDVCRVWPMWISSLRAKIKKNLFPRSSRCGSAWAEKRGSGLRPAKTCHETGGKLSKYTTFSSRNIVWWITFRVISLTRRFVAFHLVRSLDLWDFATSLGLACAGWPTAGLDFPRAPIGKSAGSLQCLFNVCFSSDSDCFFRIRVLCVVYIALQCSAVNTFVIFSLKRETSL